MLVAMTGCSGDSGEGFNEADVSFATDMTQHHAQALQMANLTVGRSDLDVEVQKLADEIRTAQLPEIATMGRWLKKWDQPVPTTGLEHSDEGHHVELDTDMPGMMSNEQMSSLERATGPEFRRMWLRMMIEHHQGALTMAENEVREGEHPAAVQMAGEIEKTQTREITRMRAMLG
jgi:uncharacterized protein (DUF305 family)